jgi:hypothetical protein
MTASDIKSIGYSTIRTVLASSLKSEIGSNKSEAENLARREGRKYHKAISHCCKRGRSQQGESPLTLRE